MWLWNFAEQKLVHFLIKYVVWLRWRIQKFWDTFKTGPTHEVAASPVSSYSQNVLFFMSLKFKILFLKFDFQSLVFKVWFSKFSFQCLIFRVWFLKFDFQSLIFNVYDVTPAWCLLGINIQWNWDLEVLWLFSLQ